jgi:hypothetical protein
MVTSLKKQLELDISMGKILQILSVNPFQRVSLNQLLTEIDARDIEGIECNQLMFNGF